MKNKPDMNPFGEEENPRPFRDMDLLTKALLNFMLFSSQVTLIRSSGVDPCVAPTFCMDLRPPTPDARKDGRRRPSGRAQLGELLLRDHPITR